MTANRDARIEKTTFSRTEVVLLAIHKAPVVPLSDICVRYFNNVYVVARRRAIKKTLPFPAFQLDDSAKAPWMVRVSDLAEFIDTAAAAGVKAWEHSQV